MPAFLFCMITRTIVKGVVVLPGGASTFAHFVGTPTLPQIIQLMQPQAAQFPSVAAAIEAMGTETPVVTQDGSVTLYTWPSFRITLTPFVAYDFETQ